MESPPSVSVTQSLHNITLFYEVRMQYERSQNGKIIKFVVHHGSKKDILHLFQICYTFMQAQRPHQIISLGDSEVHLYTFEIPILALTSSLLTFASLDRSNSTSSFLDTNSGICDPRNGYDTGNGLVKKHGSTSCSPIGVARLYEKHGLSQLSGVSFLEIQPAPSHCRICFMRHLKQYSSLRYDFEFRIYLAMVLLGQDHLSSCDTSPLSAKILDGPSFEKAILINSICELFENRLLFRGTEQDKWNVSGIGRDRFRDSVRRFIDNESVVEFCLPAFPCKSSNFKKVASVFPDGAEFEALYNLHCFCHELGQLYPFSCRIDIISDGHVFSDCIGVDDEVVSAYNHKLQEMSNSIHELLKQNLSASQTNPISFKDLSNLLFPLQCLESLIRVQDIEKIPLKHIIQTQTTSRGEMCRKLLMHICASSERCLKHVIRENSKSALTTLYRGFSRFMLEDLTSHPDLRYKSTRQQKKMAQAVGLEMMHRNQAYSHLVELALPRRIRFSIHAHNNTGPKFAISLLRRDQFRVLRSMKGIQLDADCENTDENAHLHIPTPWHNVIVEVEKSMYKYVCKAELIEMALSDPQSIWSSCSGYVQNHARGGRYILKVSSIDLKQPNPMQAVSVRL